MSGVGLARTALGLACAGGLLAGGVLSWGPTTVRAPGLVVPAMQFRIDHDGAGAVQWTVLDGSVPGGPAVTSQGVVVAGRLSPLELSLADGVAHGAAVQSGQPLATLSAPATQAAADASLEAAETTTADFARLAEQGRAAEVQGAAAGLTLAEANLARAQRAAAVSRSLVERGAAGTWEAELADLDVKVQEAAVRAARAELSRARGMNLRAEVDAVAAAGDAADAGELRAAVDALAPGLRAPFAGTVRRLAAPGLLAVDAEGPTLVQVAITEREVGRVVPGARVTFHGSDSQAPIAGTLLEVSAEAVAGPAGPAVWALARLDAAAPVGSTGVAHLEAEAW